METNITLTRFQALVLILVCFCSEFSISTDTITSTQSVKDPETIVSIGQIFKLGFFSPANTTNRYVGIMYNRSVQTVAWVANRDKPLNDSSGTVRISEDGNLIILNGHKEIIWSSNISNPVANSSAQLLDTGNLVLQDNSSGRILWQSFQHPSDSYLEEMTMSANSKTGERNLLTSWKSPDDPSIGTFSYAIVPLNIPQFIVWNGSNPYWRSGPWNGQIFIGIQTMFVSYQNGFTLKDDKEGTISITYSFANGSSLVYFHLNSEGTLQKKILRRGEDWQVFWSSIENDCEVYGKCGPFGSCNPLRSPICTCLRGFEPMHMDEWSRGNWSSGCIRKAPLMQCGRNSTVNEDGKEDGFFKLTGMKVPDFTESLFDQEDNCGSLCLNNCSCIAYAYETGIGCMQWSGSLIDIQKFSSGGVDLYIRVAYSELDDKKNMTVIITTTTVIGSLTIAICAYFSWRWMAKHRGKAYQNHSPGRMLRENTNENKLENLPLYSFEQLANATDNFHSSNKLGQGGFGPVYKGKLSDGQEIAIKRLSRSSGQGIEEFMNEVVVISGLQHRNLVRLHGCCVEREEKILIYEYMSNGSLDAFLFDSLKQELLDWSKRVSIIKGIGQGLLYLHRYSRLKIIHRDLKVSNILLDKEFNPKISDFGLARIFGDNQDQANTKRVVGTYGYMSPEYAMEGRFSEKSDVYSFGVLILEVISGRKNNSFYHDEHSLSLLGFAWKLWNEDNILALADPKIFDKNFSLEIRRYIHVGLLCVEESVRDRPSISVVISMLSSDIVDLPFPKQLAFTTRQISPESESSQERQERCSINIITITNLEGR